MPLCARLCFKTIFRRLRVQTCYTYIVLCILWGAPNTVLTLGTLNTRFRAREIRPRTAKRLSVLQRHDMSEEASAPTELKQALSLVQPIPPY